MAGPEDEGTRAHNGKSDISSSEDKLWPPHTSVPGPGSQRTSSRLGAGTSRPRQVLRPQVCAARRSSQAQWGRRPILSGFPQPSWGCRLAALQEHQGDPKRRTDRRLRHADMDWLHGSKADMWGMGREVAWPHGDGPVGSTRPGDPTPLIGLTTDGGQNRPHEPTSGSLLGFIWCRESCVRRTVAHPPAFGPGNCASGAVTRSEPRGRPEVTSA